MAGFGDLLAVLAAIDAKGKSVITTMEEVADSGRVASPVLDAIGIARAEIERLTLEIAGLSTDRSASDISKVEIDERDRLRALASRRLAVANEKLAALESDAAAGTATAEADAPAMVRILGQMRAIQAGAADAEVAIESLSARTDEASAEVVLKISKALAAILDPGNGEGVSGRWDKDTGQFLGGAFSNERARDLVDRFNELLAIQDQKLTAFEQFYVNESLKMTASQFRVEFGSKLGDIKGLAKALRDYLAATAKKDAATGPTSGTLGRPKSTSTATTSIAVLRWTGGLR